MRRFFDFTSGEIKALHSAVLMSQAEIRKTPLRRYEVLNNTLEDLKDELQEELNNKDRKNA